jgi:type VI protein secretion system component Hcp
MRRTQFLRAALVTCTLHICTAAVVTAAAVPHLVNYQGRLTTTEGEPVADSNHTVTFRICDDSLAGNVLWTETHPTVATSDGLFAVLLGSIDSLTPDDLASGGDVEPGTEARYLEIQVGGDLPISPRTRIASMPYSLVTHRMTGDVETTYRKIIWTWEIDKQGNGSNVTIWTDAEGSNAQLESTDGISLTKAIDKATPNLMLAAKKKKASAVDSAYVETRIEGDSVTVTLESTDGPNLTKSIDQASPLLYKKAAKRFSIRFDSD